jgi:hypothetical protein
MPDDKPCNVHQFKLQNHEDRLNKIDEILEKVRNRPPVWVTLVLGVLLAFIGYLVSNAGGVT